MTIEQLCAGIDGFAGSNSPSDFDRGVDTAKGMEYITIATNNTWGGRSDCGGSVSSYERIGYHAGSIDFIRGALSTGCAVRVFRYRFGGLMEFTLCSDCEG